jgi:hypothetical protein
LAAQGRGYLNDPVDDQNPRMLANHKPWLRLGNQFMNPAR